MEIMKNRILFVDDDYMNLSALTHILSEEYTVYAEKNGLKCLSTAKIVKPHLILLDVVMPEINGFDVINLLREDEFTKNIPVIFVTGKNTAEDEVRGLSLGAVDYIYKPFNPLVVKTRVRNQMQLINQKRNVQNLKGISSKDYILNLRKIVGTTPLLMCGASVIVENEKGEILLQQRADNKLWGYSGGSVNINEKVEDAAKRELFEETGIVAEEMELFGVFSGEDLYYIYPNGDEVSNIDIVFICKKYSGELNPDENECLDAAFFPIDALPENLSPPCKPALMQYVAGKRLG